MLGDNGLVVVDWQNMLSAQSNGKIDWIQFFKASGLPAKQILIFYPKHFIPADTDMSAGADGRRKFLSHLSSVATVTLTDATRVYGTVVTNNDHTILVDTTYYLATTLGSPYEVENLLILSGDWVFSTIIKRFPNLKTWVAAPRDSMSHNYSKMPHVYILNWETLVSPFLKEQPSSEQSLTDKPKPRTRQPLSA